MGVCTKERKGITAEVLMATPCTKSLGCESGGSKHGGDVGRRLCRFLLMFIFFGANRMFESFAFREDLEWPQPALR